MEISQSVLLAMFLIICLCLHAKGFDEIIPEIYQDAGIWIVIASCVAEYLLLLTYIGVAAYDFFKNRKHRNEAEKMVNNGFIKYGKRIVEKKEDSKNISGSSPCDVDTLMQAEKTPTPITAAESPIMINPHLVTPLFSGNLTVPSDNSNQRQQVISAEPRNIPTNIPKLSNASMHSHLLSAIHANGDHNQQLIPDIERSMDGSVVMKQAKMKTRTIQSQIKKSNLISGLNKMMVKVNTTKIAR